MGNKGPLWTRDIEEQKSQYDEKNDILSFYGERVEAQTMYEDIFKDLDMVVPVIISDEDEERHIVKMSVQEAIDQSKGRNDVFLGGSSYFKGFISKATARHIYCLIVDMDNVYSGILNQIFLHGWTTANGEPMPRPSYIVNSGTGLHLYFLFKKPLPRYKMQAEEIDQLYRRLAVLETTHWNFLKKSVQWFGQDFRVAGGNGKNGWENTVFKVGDSWDVDELAAMVGLDYKFIYENSNRRQQDNKKQKYSKSYFRRTGYYLNSRVYESSLERCREETNEGNRYLSMCALSVLAWKCKVDKEKLHQDLLSLLDFYNSKNCIKPVKPREIDSAIKMYNPKAMTTPRERTEDWLGWKFKGTKRNGRKQSEHLRAEYWKREDGRPAINVCAQNRELSLKFMREAGEIHGRPKGSGTKKEIVENWQAAHPDGKKIDCEKETGLSRHTVLKWWKSEG